jgi:hypothetical protein
MTRKFSRNEVVILNPLQTRYQLISTRVFVPLYAAAIDGIYVINRKKLLTKYGPRVILAHMLGGFGALIFFSGILVALNPYTQVTGLTSLGGVIAMLIGGLMLYFARKYTKKLDVKVDAEKGLEGELVIPWKEVKTIVVTNVRKENVANRPSLILNTISPTYKEIGDWHVLTTDGRDITIPFVDDPYNKLEYVKRRFGLNF